MCEAATSKLPPPGTRALSSIAFFTARRPSRSGSLIWSIVCWFGPARGGGREVTNSGLQRVSPGPQTEASAELSRAGARAGPSRPRRLTLDEDGAAPGVADVLDEGVLLLPQRLLVHPPRPAQHVLAQVLHRVDGQAPTGQRQPLHVAALGPAQGQDPLLGEHVEGEGVDAFLVDHHEGLALLAHLGTKGERRRCSPSLWGTAGAGGGGRPTLRLKSMTCRTLSSVKRRSEATNLSRSSAFE